ncbi:MAG: HemK/PrmC family methyltransferase, partial [Pseudomonadota bacterium]
MSESWEALRRRGAERLAGAGVEGAARDAEVILRWASGLDGAALSARGDEAAAADAATRFDEGIEARAARRPASHIVGGREFWGRWFEVTPDVLDPRPETETLIAAALDGPAPGKALDLGVGSGCLLATILAERPEATGVGVDASRAALAVAGRNLDAHGLGGRAKLKLGDWLDGLEEGFDLILCNPPYIAEEEMPGLAPEVANHEPRLA